MKQQSKKTAKQRRILVASMVLAAVITIGGTFAWFTSSDVVTNKLSASNKYQVSITETYTPPTNWIPGQTVTKEVGVVNTGNIGALVKVSLSHALVLKVAGSEKLGSDNAIPTGAVEITEDEAKALQAGGRRLVVNSNAFTGAVESVDSSSLTTPYTGWNVFLREEEVAADSSTEATGDTTSTYTYAGYYYDGTHYYEMADGAVAAEGSIAPTMSELKLKTEIDATGNPYENPTVSAINTTDASNPYIQVTYDIDGDNSGSGSTTEKADDDIVIDIYLDSAYATNWDYVNGTFYYKKILTSGTASEKLITSVKLDESVVEDSYVSFDYDLNVIADSVQVTEDGKFITAAVATWTDVTPTASTSEGGDSVTSIQWVAKGAT